MMYDSTDILIRVITYLIKSYTICGQANKLAIAK